MFGFSSIVAKTITEQNTDKKNYFEKLNEMIRSDKEKVNAKFRELKTKVKGGK